MGRLTDSLNEAATELDAIEAGIERMNDLGEELLDNTAEVAQSALKVGYMTGQRDAASEAEIEPDSEPGFEAGEAKIAAGAAAALPAIESLHEELKQLRSSRNSLQTANDSYRIKRLLVQNYLREAGVDLEILVNVEKIYQLNGVRSAPSLAEKMLDFDRSQILAMLRQVATYSKHLLD